MLYYSTLLVGRYAGFLTRAVGTDTPYRLPITNHLTTNIMALTRKLPKLNNVVEVICPPSVLCLDCAYWNDDKGCELGRETESTSMAIFGCCGLKKPKEEKK